MASEWLFPTNDEQEEPSEKTRNEELFVFGYHCKLFRDDEQAKMVDAGTYMIPWMGDEKLKIDRYDGRGHLYDLRPYDADNMKGQPAPVLSEEEQQIEKFCDEERYLEIHTDVAVKAMYEEEEWKRYYESLSEGYQAVGFSYDSFGQPTYAEPVSEEPKSNPDDAVYVPPPELQVPADLPIPATIKENAIIEKTAKFIAEHGIQMEIVMKTKQSNNPQFQFMHFENQLHPYYKHLIKMIKSKKYIPKSPVKEEPPDTHNDSAEGDGGYLHPTLMTTNRASPTPQEVYKPVPMPKVSIHETSYGQLLTSMSKVNKELAEKNREKEVKVKKEIKTEPPDSNSLPAGVGEPVYGSSMPPPPGIEPVQLPCDKDIKQEPNSSLRTSSPPEQIVPPPPDLQPIIDRMAMYVAKNGEEFSIVVKSKKDPRFQFLETWHTHYPYYDFKRHLFQEELEREKKEEEAEERRKEQEKADILAKGVKFKLKKAIKEQESSTTLEKKPVFEYDDSGDENDSDSTVSRLKSNNVSGTSTPVRDGEGITESKSSEHLERKMAEQRLRDRIAASAREKLSQVDKEKQIKLERKKKAAMFINLLKSKNGEGEDETKESGTPSISGRSTPVKADDSSSSRHKSKHKSRDRSRSRDRSSRSRRSRSRSSSRSKSKKKKRHRSPTPPSAYTVPSWRSSSRFPLPPPPPRYGDIRGRYSRSPSKGRSSRHRSRSRSKGRSSKQRSRSRSPSSRSKSKKKKRSKSPKSRKDDSSSSHRKSSKKKKKRSRSKSVDKKSILSPVPETVQDSRVPSTADDTRDTSPANESDCCIVDDPLEEGETRDSSPEPGQITDNSDVKDSSQRSTPVPPDIKKARPKRKRSGSSDSSRSRSRSKSPKSGSGSDTSKSRSRSNSPKSSKINSIKARSISKSPSKSPSLKMSKESMNGQQSRSPTSQSRSREMTPVSFTVDPLSENGASNDKTYSAGTESSADKNVSSYMLDRVRAIIKASRAAIKDEDSTLDDS